MLTEYTASSQSSCRHLRTTFLSWLFPLTCFYCKLLLNISSPDICTPLICSCLMNSAWTEMVLCRHSEHNVRHLLNEIRYGAVTKTGMLARDAVTRLGTYGTYGNICLGTYGSFWLVQPLPWLASFRAEKIVPVFFKCQPGPQMCPAASCICVNCVKLRCTLYS